MSGKRHAAGKTRRLLNPVATDLNPDAAYLYSSLSTEPRGSATLWSGCKEHRPENCIEVVGHTDESATLQFDTKRISVYLNDPEALVSVFSEFDSAYIDVSGLPHHVWAPLLRAGFAALSQLNCVYVEPAEYRRHPNPTSRSEFDLSDGFRGVYPIPGFAKLAGPETDDASVLVVLVGFEGKRAAHLASELDPVPPVYAVLGVPGFRIEYPQVACASNGEFLAEYRAQPNVRFAAASCPFEAYDVLEQIHADCAGKYMYIAPVGTKPHAVGAICYALKHPSKTELLYDHPLRKANRTDGVGLVHIYSLKPSHVAP